jgi:hypothetical protein
MLRFLSVTERNRRIYPGSAQVHVQMLCTAAEESIGLRHRDEHEVVSVLIKHHSLKV